MSTQPKNPTLGDEIARLRWVADPDKDYANFLVTGPDDYALTGLKIVVHVICLSTSGSGTLYKLVCDKTDSEKFQRDYSDDVEGWAKFVRECVPDILNNATLAYLNRMNPGQKWRIKGIVGWNFLTDLATQRRPIRLKSRPKK